jgi:methyl-accepting chemotaxis protein
MSLGTEAPSSSWAEKLPHLHRWAAALRLKPLNLRHLSVRASLVSAFALFLIGILLMGGFSLLQMGRLNGVSQSLFDNAYRAGLAAEQLRSAVLRGSRAQTQLVTATTANERNGLGKQIEDVLKAVDERLATLKELSQDQETQQKVQGLATALTTWGKDQREFITLVKSQPIDLVQMSADVGMNDALLVERTKKLEKMVDELVAHRAQAAQATIAMSAEIYRSSLVYGGIFTLILGVVSLGVGLYAMRNIIHQLGAEPVYVKSVAGRIASGDLAMDIRVPENDDSSIVYSLQEMQSQLSETVRRIAATSKQVAFAAEEINQGNQDLSERTDVQAAALDQTTHNVRELADISRQNAESARQANALTQEATHTAQSSGEVMALVAHTMEQISQSTKAIQAITGVIESIAFQTNILALNAAVEAAHAGEQGRGFAVVASEVRDLAQRSANAAREINTLVGSSTTHVQTGVALTKKAAAAIDRASHSILSASAVMNEIHTASESQSEGIAKISQAVLDLDQSTQQNATMVQQSLAAAQSLNEQAKVLDELLEEFHLRPEDSV